MKYAVLFALKSIQAAEIVVLTLCHEIALCIYMEWGNIGRGGDIKKGVPMHAQKIETQSLWCLVYVIL